MKKIRLNKSDYDVLKDLVIAVAVTVLIVKFVPFKFDNIAQEVMTYITFGWMFMSLLVNADSKYERRCK